MSDQARSERRDAPHPDNDRAAVVAGLKRDKDAVLVAYHGGETSNAIAARYGVSSHTVLYWLHRWGADVRPANRTLPEHVTGKGLQAALARERRRAATLQAVLRKVRTQVATAPTALLRSLRPLLDTAWEEADAPGPGEEGGKR